MTRARNAQKVASHPTLGLDVGGVLIDRVGEDSDTSFFGSRPMETPMVHGALESVARLGELFEGRVVVVSKAGPKFASLTMEWMSTVGFFEMTCLDLSKVHFVRERPDKARICRRLGVSHFVDDRRDVLDHLGDVRHRYLFVGGVGNHAPPSPAPGFPRVETWSELVEILQNDIHA